MNPVIKVKIRSTIMYSCTNRKLKIYQHMLPMNVKNETIYIYIFNK